MNSISEESNYEKVFSQFKSRFLESNLEETSKILQLKADDEYLYVPFFCKICRVARATGEITGEKNQEISVTDRLCITFAVTRNLRRKVTGRFRFGKSGKRLFLRRLITEWRWNL